MTPKRKVIGIRGRPFLVMLILASVFSALVVKVEDWFRPSDGTLLVVMAAGATAVYFGWAWPGWYGKDHGRSEPDFWLGWVDRPQRYENRLYRGTLLVILSLWFLLPLAFGIFGPDTGH